ncbi:Protein of uncharacterised function (DUF3272) [Streptococcus pneumoniae]|nr:Protein of uncharacterised function (DUF3272) [Streptococcus pneumoniae]
MNKQQFIIMALFTAAETYFFNEAWMTGRYIMAAFGEFYSLEISESVM